MTAWLVWLLLPAAAILVPMLLNLGVVLSVRRAIRPEWPRNQADCILVLGCGLNRDGTPGTYLRNRLDCALRLYHAGAAPKLLMSGDHSRPDYDEVNAMKRYAVLHGVPPEAVFMDHAGFSTYESMVRASRVFACKSVIVVTQGFHMHRSLYDAKRQGMKAWGTVAENFDGAGKAYNRHLRHREYLARCKDVLYCLLRHPVANCAVTTPITGDGSVTDDAHTAEWMRELQNR